MALDVATGTFNIGTGAIGTTVSVTTLTFQPKVVIFMMGGRTAVGQAEATHQLGMSYMVGAGDRGGTAHRSVHNSASTDTQSLTYEDAAVATVNSSGGIPFEDGQADFDAFLVNGFRLIIDSVFPANYLIHYLALGGSDITNVAGMRVSIPNPGVAPGTITEHNIGFRPDAALGFGRGPDGIIAGGTSCFSFGVAAQGQGDGPSGYDPINAVLVEEDIGGDPTSITGSYCRRGEFLNDVSAFGGFGYTRAKLVRWLSNGFRLQWIESSSPIGSILFRVLCIQGARFDIGFGQTKNLSNGLKGFVEDVKFKPKALIFASNNKAESPNISATPPSGSSRIPFNAEVSIGFATATAQNVVGVIDQDAQATTNVSIDQRTDALYVNQSNDAAIVEEGRASLTSFDEDPGFTFTQDDADPAQSFFWFLAMADAPVATAAATTFALPDSVPHSFLQQFAPSATPWTPVYYGGPSSILFTAATPAIVLRRRAQMPVAWAGILGTRRAQIPVEWQSVPRRRASMPVEWLGVLRRRAQIPIEWRGSVVRRCTIPVDWAGSVPRRATIPVEWQGVLARRATIPVEWRGTLTRRATLPVEWAGVLRRRATMPVEWTGVINRRALIPVEWRGEIRRRAEIPVEWTGQVQTAITRRAEIPVEWTAQVPQGGLVLGGGGPPIGAAEDTYLSEAWLRFEGETLVRWSPIHTVPAEKAPRRKPRPAPIIPVVQAEPFLDALYTSVGSPRWAGSTLARWEPWVGVQESDDEAALLAALFR